MTRFARGFRKRYLDATPWNQLSKKEDIRKQKDGDDVSDSSQLNARREARRKRRQKQKACFKCREKGHTLADCPQKNEVEQGTVCYQCGSTEHTAKQCKSKKHSKGEYPLAQCFVCHGMGHISSQCPDNPKGLYPMGGGCKICGSNEHFKRDCPQKEKRGSSKGAGRRRTIVSQSADALELSETEGEAEASPLPKKRKIVKF